MARWDSKVKMKHLMTPAEDYETVQAEMSAIADIIEETTAFSAFDRGTLAKFRQIPQGDEFFAPVDYANKLIGAMYDYADEHRIWIE